MGLELELQCVRIMKIKKPNLIKIDKAASYSEYEPKDITEEEFNLFKRWLGE